MSKGSKKRTPGCREHEFAIAPLRNDLHFKQPVTLSFCRPRDHSKKKNCRKGQPEDTGSCLCCPVFNRDSNYATSTFILPEDKKNYIENQTKFKSEHELRIKECNDEKTEMLIPKPKTKHLYCNVCRTNYEDYLEHIKSELHKVSIRRAPFSKLIKDMELKYDKINQGRNSHSKNSFNTDTTQNGPQSEPEVEMLGLPTKRTKTDASFAPAFYYPFTLSHKTEAPQQQLPQMKTLYGMPMSCYGCELGTQNFGQLPSLKTMNKGEVYPMMQTMNSLPCSMSFATGMDPNMVVSFPMFYCNSFQSFQQLPQTYYTIPFMPSMQKIETVHKIETGENCN